MRLPRRRASRRPAARTSSAGGAWSRSSTPSPTSGPKRCASMRGMRVHAWRGIGAGYNKFASESFVDEMAAARGVDPLAHAPRADARTIRAPALSSRRWPRWRTGSASGRAAVSGIAFADYHDTLVSRRRRGVGRITATGKIKVHNYWIAVDPGLVIQPDNAARPARKRRRSTA